jgi:hypothetical protein
MSTREGFEPIKPKSKLKTKRVWQKKVTSPLDSSSQEFSSAEQTMVLDQ